MKFSTSTIFQMNWIANNFYPLDVNECDGNHSCPMGSVCSNRYGSFRCNCPAKQAVYRGMCVGKWFSIILLVLLFFYMSKYFLGHMLEDFNFCWFFHFVLLGFFLIEEQTTSIDDNNIYLMITIFNQIYF